MIANPVSLGAIVAAGALSIWARWAVAYALSKEQAR